MTELRGLACVEACGSLRALQRCQTDSNCSPDDHNQLGRHPEPVETDGLKIESEEVHGSILSTNATSEAVAVLGTDGAGKEQGEVAAGDSSPVGSAPRGEE